MKILKSVIFYTIILILPLMATDWPTAGFNNQRTGCSPDTFGGTQLYEKWALTNLTDTQFAVRTAAIIVSNKVMMGSYTGVMFAFDLSNGNILWSNQLGGPIVNTAAAENGVIYTGSYDWKLYALDQETGNIIWSYRVDAGFTAAPCVENGNVYIGNKNGKFYCISNGNKVWEYDTGSPIWHTAALKDTNIYFGSDNMHVYALNKTSGALNWKSAEIRGQSFRDYYPVIKDTRLFIRTVPECDFNHIVFTNDTDFVTSPERETAFAFELSDGSKSYTIPLTYCAGVMASGPPPVIYGDGTIYALAGDAWGAGVTDHDPTVESINYTTGAVTYLTNVDCARDESFTISGTADKLFIAHQDVLSYFDPATGISHFNNFGGSRCLGARDTSGGHEQLEWSRNAWHGPSQAPVAISGNRLIWQTGSIIICASSSSQ